MNTLIGLKIPLEAFMIMYLLHNEEKEMISSYAKNVRKIPTEVFKDLVSRGYLTNSSEDQDVFTIESIELTDKFKYDVLKVPNVKGVTFDEAFEQLRKHYPSKVTDPTGAVRRLHQDVDRCKKLYKTTVLVNGEVDEERHKFILQCIDFQMAELKRGNKLQYALMLSTYLSKKAWEVVEEDVKTLLKKNGTVQSTEDDGGNIDAV